MIKAVEFFAITCDNCKEDFQDEHTGYSAMNDEESIWELADNSGWTMVDGCRGEPDKHYCKQCIGISEGDELCIKLERFNLLASPNTIPTSQVATALPPGNSLKGCPFHYCDKNPVCVDKCRYAD